MTSAREERFVNRMRSCGHKCRVGDCTTVVPLDMVMCRPHWRQVPRPLRKAVSRTWGKASGLDGHVNDTKAYFRAVEAAVEAVEKVEATA